MTINFSELCDAINAKQIKVDLIKTKASAAAQPLEQEIEDMEKELFEAMEAAGLTKIKGKASEAEIKPQLKLSISDFEAFQQFVIRRKACHLFERRIGVKAYKELKDNLGGKPIPGLSEYEFKKLNVKRA